MINMAYTVTKPTETFLGKTYADIIQGWASWLLLPDADLYNNRWVVFLRGLAPLAN